MRPRRGIFWPLLLIALGLLLLLSNFGIITGVSWLAIASLWPLLLILIGLDIAFARRWPLPTLAVEVAVIAAGLALVASSPNLAPGIFVIGDGGGPGVSDVTVPRSGASELALTLNAGATRAYHVSGGATELVDAHSANPDLRLRTLGSAARPNIRIDQVSPDGFFRSAGAGDIQIRVANDVPTSLTINVGAGEFEIDLSDVRVTDARINIGASSLRLVLPKPSGDVAIRLNGGASSFTVVLPDGVESRIATTGGLLSIRSDNSRLTGETTSGCIACGTSAETSGYAAARDRVTLTISAGASSIVVR
jgi:hypothetical protein